MRILIVEDEASSSLLLKSFLAEYGDIALAEDGGKAIELFKAAVGSGNYFNLVVLDIKLPDISGLDVLKTIRDIEKESGIAPANKAKVIMSTALSDLKSIAGAFSEQCEMYLVKPVEKAMLVDGMRNLKLIG